MTAAALRLTARAKINLYLHVTGRRADGYHLMDSLVCFAELGDEWKAQHSHRENAARDLLRQTG